MRSTVIMLAAALGACARPEPPPVVVPAPEAVVAPVPAPAPPPPPVVTPATVATKAYHRAEATEGRAVTKPGATAGSINAIRTANYFARKALSELVAQDGHPTADKIAAAKRTLDDLIAAQEATPQ